MANVLPEKALQAVWAEFRSRLILVGALVFFGAAVLSGLALLPAYAVLQVEEGSLKQQDVLSSTPFGLSKESLAERNDIIRSQTFLTHLKPFISATSSATKTIHTALSLRPRGVQINGISMTNENGRKITIDGIAPGPEETNQYREALSRDGSFTSVSIPVGALVGVEGGKFTITLTSTY